MADVQEGIRRLNFVALNSNAIELGSSINKLKKDVSFARSDFIILAKLLKFAQFQPYYFKFRRFLLGSALAERSRAKYLKIRSYENIITLLATRDGNNDMIGSKQLAAVNGERFNRRAYTLGTEEAIAGRKELLQTMRNLTLLFRDPAYTPILDEYYAAKGRFAETLFFCSMMRWCLSDGYRNSYHSRGAFGAPS